MSTVFKTTYHGPTDHTGSRFSVTNLQTGKRKTVSYNHGAGNAARDAVVRAIGDELGIYVAADDLVWGGEDSKSDYWVATVTV